MGLDSYLRAHNRMVEANARLERFNREEAARQAQQAQPPAYDVPQGAPRAPWPTPLSPRRPPAQRPSANRPAQTAAPQETRYYDEDFNTLPRPHWQPRPPTP